MKRYGNLNQNLSAITSRLLKSEDLFKFLYYEDIPQGIDKLPNVSTKDKLIMIEGQKDTKSEKRQIFPYKKVPLVSEKFTCFLSMEYGVVKREGRHRNNRYFKVPTFCFYVIVAETLDDTGNGSRLLAIEQCIEDLFHGEYLEAVGECLLGTSTPLSIKGGYIGREIPLMFVDTNEKAFSHE